MGVLAGKTAIVTGAARGLGAGVAQAFCEAGASVVVADVLDEAGRAFVAALSARGFEADYRHLDVRDAQAWAALLEEVAQRRGRLDILVNNAGVNLPATIEDASLEDFDRVVAVNLKSVFIGMKTVIPYMRASGGGAIINIASNSTKMVLPQTSVYSATKAAVANLTKSTAVHCARSGSGVRVNSIHPGPHETPMLLGDGGAAAKDIPAVQAIIEAIPMGRMGRPCEIGATATFLASDAPSYITAAEIFVDGGLTVV